MFYAFVLLFSDFLRLRLILRCCEVSSWCGLSMWSPGTLRPCCLVRCGSIDSTVSLLPVLWSFCPDSCGPVRCASVVFLALLCWICRCVWRCGLSWCCAEVFLCLFDPARPCLTLFCCLSVCSGVFLRHPGGESTCPSQPHFVELVGVCGSASFPGTARRSCLSYPTLLDPS